MKTPVLSIAALSFVVQVAVAVPTFGTGLQLNSWNEADNEYPGEYLPEDFMMPIRDPDESLNDETPSEPATEQPTTQPPAIEEVTLERPPTKEEENKKTSPSQPDTPPKESNDVVKPKEEEKQKPASPEVEKVSSLDNIPLRFPDLNSPNVRRVAIVIRPMTPRTDDDIIRSSRLLELLRPENRIQVATDKEDMPKAFARIVMRITAPPAPADDNAPCTMDEGSSQEGAPLTLPTGPLPLPLPVAFQTHNIPANRPPTIKGVLLKSLVPREYLVLRDIYNIMKARAAAKDESRYDQISSGFPPKPIDFQGRNPFMSTPRYVALPRAPMMMPFPHPMYFPPPPTMEQSEPDSPESLPPPRALFSQDYDSDQFSPELNPTDNFPPTTPFGFDLPKGEGDAVDDVMKFASQMKGLFNMLLSNVPNQDSNDNRTPHIPGLESLLPGRDNAPEDYRPLHFSRRQMQFSLNK